MFIIGQNGEIFSAKGADTRRQTAKEFLKPLGGALDTAPVLRVFPNRAFGYLFVIDMRLVSGAGAREPSEAANRALRHAYH